MEVIARRKEGLFLLYAFTTLLGVGMFVLGFYASIVVSVFSVVIIAISVVICVGICRTPKEIIKYDGKNLIIGNEVYPAVELMNVNYDCAHARGIRYKWGKIILTIGDKQIKYNYVADVEEVHNRLMELRLRTGQDVRIEEVV